MKFVTLFMTLILLFSGCSEEKKPKKSGSDMKCGAGKCGANMFDGNKALAKKRANIVKQLREDDPRRDCVLKAKSTKALYNCVRNPVTGRLSLKCGSSSQEQPAMKCGEGKCGASMQAPKAPMKKEPAMKCDGSMKM